MVNHLPPSREDIELLLRQLTMVFDEWVINREIAVAPHQALRADDACANRLLSLVPFAIIEASDRIRKGDPLPSTTIPNSMISPSGPFVVATSPPIPMRLTCPSCGELHIDEGEWATKPHSSHACQLCGMVWRPAVQDTVGVKFLPGFRNEPAVTP